MPGPETIQIIRQITPTVADHAETITRRFYDLMFRGNPELRAYFNPAHQADGTQPRALADAICSFFANIERPETLAGIIEVLAHKHCALQVQPAHYPIIGRHLLAAIGDVLGDAVTPAIATAVEQAYCLLADICIRREQEIYASQASMTGGWNGFRKFVVDRKIRESENTVSFYLCPQDGKPIPEYLPGQYITLRVPVPDSDPSLRNYSLSDRPGLDYFRVSIRKETHSAGSIPDGLISARLHEHVRAGDVLDVGPPCGEFTIDVDAVGDRPVVFLAGGIGVTPLLSMAKSLVHAGVLAPICFVHAVRNSAVQPFADEVQQMVSDKDFVETRFVYEFPDDEDIEKQKCDHVGRMNSELIRCWTPWEQAEFYICGPPPFMNQVIGDLHQLGVPESRIHFEFFGPLQPLLAKVVA